MERGTHRVERPSHRAVARPGIRGDVPRGEDIARSDSRRERGQDLRRAAVEHDEGRAAHREVVPEGRERAEHEADAVRGGPSALEEPRVQDEDRHDAIGGGHGRMKGRVIVQAEVAPIPEQRGSRHRYGDSAKDEAILAKTGASVAALAGAVPKVRT